MESTKKKLAIVTGAARGIGLATAKLLSQNDYKVAIVCLLYTSDAADE